MLFQMGRSVFTFGYRADALDITVRETADRPNMRMNDEDFAAWSPGEAMLADRSGLSLDWLEIEDDGESFAALRALPVADKKALFAACVARTVKPQLAFEPEARPELEATVARLDIDFAQHVRPTAAMLWSRITKARLLDIARLVPDTAIAAAPADTPLPMHPMDPRRGESLTPMFAAFLCWLLGLEPMTRPAITGISIAGTSVLAATTDSPFFDAHLGAVDEFERNLRG